DARSKSPAPAHGLAGQDARQAPSGVAFSFGSFSLGHAREKGLGCRRQTKALRFECISQGALSTICKKCVAHRNPCGCDGSSAGLRRRWNQRFTNCRGEDAYSPGKPDRVRRSRLRRTRTEGRHPMPRKKTLKLATFNINGINSRLPNLL